MESNDNSGCTLLAFRGIYSLEYVLFIDLKEWVSRFLFCHDNVQYIEDNLKHLPRLSLVTVSICHSLWEQLIQIAIPLELTDCPDLWNSFYFCYFLLKK